MVINNHCIKIFYILLLYIKRVFLSIKLNFLKYNFDFFIIFHENTVHDIKYLLVMGWN